MYIELKKKKDKSVKLRVFKRPNIKAKLKNDSLIPVYISWIFCAPSTYIF